MVLRNGCENSDPIRDIIEKVVNDQFKDKPKYDANNAKSWCEDIIRQILKQLGEDQFQPCKYLANCLIVSKKSNGVHTYTMSLGDPQNDGSVAYQLSNDTMKCVTTVWSIKY